MIGWLSGEGVPFHPGSSWGRVYPSILGPLLLQPWCLPGSPEPSLFLSLSPSSWPSAFCCVCCRLSLWQTSKACPTVRTILIAWLWEGKKETVKDAEIPQGHNRLWWLRMCKVIGNLGSQKRKEVEISNVSQMHSYSRNSTYAIPVLRQSSPEDRCQRQAF